MPQKNDGSLSCEQGKCDCPHYRERCGVSHSPDLLPDERSAPDSVWAVNSVITTIRIRRRERRVRCEALAFIVLLVTWVWLVHTSFAVSQGTVTDVWQNYIQKCGKTVSELPLTVRELFALWFLLG